MSERRELLEEIDYRVGFTPAGCERDPREERLTNDQLRAIIAALEEQ